MLFFVVYFLNLFVWLRRALVAAGLSSKKLRTIALDLICISYTLYLFGFFVLGVLFFVVYFLNLFICLAASGLSCSRWGPVLCCAVLCCAVLCCVVLRCVAWPLVVGQLSQCVTEA